MSEAIDEGSVGRPSPIEEEGSVGRPSPIEEDGARSGDRAEQPHQGGQGLCPWLGTEEDRRLRFREPAEAHVCYAQEPPAAVEARYQAEVCLAAGHTGCRFYAPPPPTAVPARMEADENESGLPPEGPNWLRAGLWGAVAVLALVVAIVFGRQLFSTPLPADTPAPTHTLTAAPTAVPSPAGGAASPTLAIQPPTATATPYPGGAIYEITPEAGAAGWVASDEDRGNHLGDSYLYTGLFDGVVYHGIFQFDLSAVPRGATIHSAALEISGLSAQRLGTGGVWQVRSLVRAEDEEWSRTTFQDVHNAEVLWTLLPALVEGDLAAGRVNRFELARSEIAEIEQRLLDQHYTLSFRIDGPLGGANNVFAWDTGYAAATQGHAPRLVLSVGPAPKTPLPTGTPPYVVVTSTPTPANVLTAEARGLTATAMATTVGQPTATSIYEWTATPPLVVTSTPVPGNGATATMAARLATAIAFTTGTFTPTPEYQVTATATPAAIPIGQITIVPGPEPTARPAFPAALRGLILFESNRAGSLGPWAMDGQGSGVAWLTARWPYEVASAREATSPDGSQVVYAGRSENKPAVMVRPVAGAEGTPVTALDDGSVSEPVWSPTGNWIAFTAASGTRSAVWVVRSNGNDLRQLTLVSEGSASHPTFSPDGTRVAYALADAAGRRQIWAAALDGTGKVSLSRNEYDEWAPVWAK